MAVQKEEPLGRTALILYGSETGNAQDVAEELGRLCERLRFETQVCQMDDVDIRELLRHDLILVSLSTTGQGDLPANVQSFWKALRSVRLPPGCLKTVKFASFGLGDSSYPQFNWAHRKLHNRLLQLGAQSIFERGESDEQHPEGIDGTFLPWSLALRERLLDVFPLPDGQSAIPDHVFLEPKWILEELPDSHELNGTTCEKSPPRAGGTDALSDEVPPDGLFNIRDGIVATVYSNTRLTPLEHWQDVRHLTLDLHEKKSYTPGDILAICPKNFPSDVNHFLELMGWTAIADSRIDFVPNPQRTRTIASGRGSQPPITFPTPNRTLTLRELLTNHLDIISIPRRSFFAQLLHYSNDPFQRERLQEFTNPELVDELYDYTTRPRRSILEVLDEFTSVKIPWQKVCSVIPMMRPRQFSIASGGSLKVAEPGNAASARVELLVAIVKYRTVIKRIRQGVATRYIASLRPGQQITVSMVKGGLGFKQEDIKRPVVMVGPGTGVAPMRSLIYERLSIRKELQSLPPSAVEGDLLFYGCRNRKADFFFEDEWKRLAAETGLTVLPAFSRDQQVKVYVQDLIRQHAKRVYSALAEHNGLFYVSGSSGKMPQAVREALIEVFQQEGQMAREDAEAYLAKMEKESRYKQETW